MALGATIYKATIDVSDLDRSYYGNSALTIARHPSETEARMMVRVLAFSLYAGENLQFGRGIAADDEAALWEINERGDIGTWIEVGVPDNKLLRKAAGRSDRVVVLAYDEAKVAAWWQSNRADFTRIPKLTIRVVSDTDLEHLAAMAKRNMRLAATIQDGMVWLADETQNLEISVRTIMEKGEPLLY